MTRGPFFVRLFLKLECGEMMELLISFDIRVQGLREVRWSPGQQKLWGPRPTPRAIQIYKYIYSINTSETRIFYQTNIDEKPRIISQQFN
jgi:hypothetical protein